MNFLRLPRTINSAKVNSLIARRSNTNSRVALNHDDYTDNPEYPQILNMSLKSRKKRERESVHMKIQDINTVEEKQIALNMPHYYGWNCVMLDDTKVPYNAMPLVQGYTRTHFTLTENLPKAYEENEQIAKDVTKEIMGQIEAVIAMELEGIEHDESSRVHIDELRKQEDNQASRVVKQINRIIINNLADKLPHVLSAQVDYDPRHEAFWLVGGNDAPRRTIEKRKQYCWMKNRLYEPINRAVQYKGTPFLALRHRLPLKHLIPYSEANNPDFKVPKFVLQPKAVGYFENYRFGTNIPGFWPGDQDEFGLLSYHGRGHILGRSFTGGSFNTDDDLEALHCQAIKSSFAWLLAQANYQGFTTFNDITYPLITQTVITNGNLCSFYAYQLNTIEMHNEKVNTNSKHNICFGTKPMQLYESLENGKVKGLNEEVLKMLVQFYLNIPEERDHDLKPYLGKEEQFIADIEDDKRRCWLEDTYKFLMSNRPRHNLLPETYVWEDIYKIKFDTRGYEPKRRPFELEINPFKRRLDEHLPPYIPKVLRPYPRARKKFETTYYPKV